MSHTGCCGLSPFPPKTTVFHHYHDSQINNDTKQKWSNSNHHLLPLSSSSATLNNLQQRSRVHFGWEAGSPKPVCKLSVHEDTLPWLFPCNFSCSPMDIIYLTLWHGPKKPKEEKNTHHSKVSNATIYATRPFVAEPTSTSCRNYTVPVFYSACPAHPDIFNYQWYFKVPLATNIV